MRSCRLAALIVIAILLFGLTISVYNHIGRGNPSNEFLTFAAASANRFGQYVELIWKQADFGINATEKRSIIALIFSAPEHFSHRNTVRSTWVRYLALPEINGSHFFIIGATKDSALQTKIAQEQALHADILQYSFSDTYRNLTYKTLAALSFLNSSFSQQNFHYILKTDDDVFVDIPKLISFALQHNLCGRYCQQSFFCHSYRPNDRPHRNPQSKYYVPPSNFADAVYPKYCAGTGYMLTSDLIIPLLQAAQNTSFLFLEDVFLGLCAVKVGNVSFVEFPQGYFLHTEQNYQLLSREFGKRGQSKVNNPEKSKC